MDTITQVSKVISLCKDIFQKKMVDYGASWRILRPKSITDQIFIKVNRIRSIEELGKSLVEDNIEEDFIGIVNYGLMAIIQCQRKAVYTPDIDIEEACKLYDKVAAQTVTLLKKKNHDYGEAWRNMRISSLVDLILMKVYRTKQIEDHCGETIISEGVEANYMDMVNYAIFALIKLDV